MGLIGQKGVLEASQESRSLVEQTKVKRPKMVAWTSNVLWGSCFNFFSSEERKDDEIRLQMTFKKSIKNIKNVI